MKITYGLIEEMHALGEEIYISYGIAAYTETEKDGMTVILDVVHDITVDRQAIIELIILCNRLQLSLIHMNDVIEDFLTN